MLYPIQIKLILNAVNQISAIQKNIVVFSHTGTIIMGFYTFLTKTIRLGIRIRDSIYYEGPQRFYWTILLGIKQTLND